MSPREGTPSSLELPDRTAAVLAALRRRVWRIKLAEGALAAAFGLLVSYLLVFLLDRLWDTPAWLRGLLLVLGAAGPGIALPLKWHRWVWRTRRFDQVARLVGHTFPRLGDQLLGVVELAVRDEADRQRSQALCRAAMRQVDQAIGRHDFDRAVPHPQHRRWAVAVTIPGLLALIALTVVPRAGSNALLRWLMPWGAIQRYTFARLEPLPAKMVVPYGEPFTVTASLAPGTAWSPRRATARYGSQARISAGREDRTYRFTIPSQTEPRPLALRVGDARPSVAIVPTARPELIEAVARVTLPAYLGYARPLEQDIRGGILSAVRGSRAIIEATATRPLAEAKLDGAPLQVDGRQITTGPLEIRASQRRAITWLDENGLSGKGPFQLTLRAVDDRPPTIAARRLSPEQVVLEEDVLRFQVEASDDFGLARIGMQWEGVEDSVSNPRPAKGEKVVLAGHPEARQLEASATFSAASDGVAPQSLRIRLYAIDYFPDREPVYSATFVVRILSPQDHAIYLTGQLRRWFRQAVDVERREQRLHQTNRQLRQLPTAKLDEPATRRKIETQAAAEAANGRRLAAVTGRGKELIRRAMRNDQFNVATLETWAEMLVTLESLAKRRMPSVADLLKRAAGAPAGKQKSRGSRPAAQPGTSPLRASVVRDTAPPGGTKPREKPPGQTPPSAPSVVDVESSLRGPDDPKPPSTAPPARSQLRLPTTTILGGGPPPKAPRPAACPARKAMDAAVEEQEDLLDQFAKVIEALEKILRNLEGSTFVKRLKAASRRQLDVARQVNGRLLAAFGIPEDKVGQREEGAAKQLAEREKAHSEMVYLIQDDLEAYYQRVREGKFKAVLNEMKDSQVVRKIRDISDMVTENLAGQSIAEAEFWADTLDRWAEQLVGPG